MPTWARVAAILAWLVAPGSSAPGFDGPVASIRPGASRALIVVGLPGDREHHALFKATARGWKDWLVGPLGFPSGEVRLLSGESAEVGFSDAPATRESIIREAEALRGKSTPGDRVWVFVLGHANLDDGHALLHLPGPDLRDDQFAALFRGLAGREQVFWMTTAASGSFLPGLSTPGRIVVAATERSGESNETEFPHALAEVARLPADRLDLDRDGQVSVREVFLATVDRVEARFASDERAPTEHAQLDDNGDGVGTEARPSEPAANPDGASAARTFLPKVEPPSPPKPPARSAHGTNRQSPIAR